MTSKTPPSTPTAIPRAPLPFLGLACAVGVSTIYYNQPLLLAMGHSYGATAGQTGFIAVATQVGYAVGLLTFVPLGDVLERRGLMMRMYGAVSVALLLVAVAPNLTWLIIASAVMGLLASVTHIALPIAPDLVGDKERGRAIGIVMTGLLLGILLARTFAGWVSHIHGWRWVFAVAAVMNAAFVPLLLWVMPKLPPKHELSYGAAMRSLWTLWRTEPLLRESCMIGALVFASFSCFWTTLAFVLDSHYGLGPGVAGTFGLVGAAGAMIAPVAGRLSDRHGPRYVVTVGICTLAASYLLLWGEERAALAMGWHIAALAMGVVVLDLGAQMTQVANQTRIFGLVPSARSRLNTVYMTVYFTGAAAGSALATVAWVHWRWDGVCGLALGFIALAGLRHTMGRKDAGGGLVAEDPAFPVTMMEM
ncbi:MFS transporter [Granulicella arctica]|uniref:Putative MFS family arabinose efflux permease n=1 Tax=Granulicella arctica TaxID=940613 RepID=A0A7Y9TFB8_9BACT|nr:MFS transporter [Granulicella arctica]NYF78174.1 putative MFS family arabinose efflux permease [Granulicella arctica]